MWTAHWEWFLAFFRSQTTCEHVCMPKNVLQDSSGTGKKSMLTPEAPHWIMSSFKTRVTGSFTCTQWVAIKLNPTRGASETVDFLSSVFLSQVYIWVSWLVSSYQEHVNFLFTLSFMLRLSHRPVMSWSADVTKGRGDRLLSPAKQTCRLNPTSSRRWWWSTQSTTYSCFLFWSILYEIRSLYEMRSLRRLPVPLTGKTERSNQAARQINCRNEVSAVLPTPCWPLK